MSWKIILPVVIVIVAILGFKYMKSSKSDSSMTPITSNSQNTISTIQSNSTNSTSGISTNIKSGTSLDQDLSSIDAQMNTVNTNSAQVDQSFSDKPVAQTE